MKVQTVLVTVSNDLYTDQRVHKVCTFIQKQGYKVKLVGRLKPDSKSELKRSYETHRMKMLFHKGPLFYAEFNLKLFFYLLFHSCSKIVSNDLDTLLACYTAKILKRNCDLIYDSHEYFTEVPELVNRPKVQKIWEMIEGQLFPKLTSIYTVNDSIANLYKIKYNKDIRVVRNISPLWVNSSKISKKELGIPEDKLILIIQGAGINIDRGAEEAVEAMKYLQDSCLLIVGNGDVIPLLKEYVKQNALQEKVLFFPKMDYEKMMQYTFIADIGLTLDKSSNINYQYSLPNKLFDYIHAETPVLGSELIEVSKIINTNKVGITVADVTVEKIVKTVKFIQNKPTIFEEWKQNCKRTKEILNWEKECNVLEEFYPKIY